MCLCISACVSPQSVQVNLAFLDGPKDCLLVWQSAKNWSRDRQQGVAKSEKGSTEIERDDGDSQTNHYKVVTSQSSHSGDI